MGDDYSTTFPARALALVDAYITGHPECSREDEQPVQGATNRVVFIRRGGQRLVCKVFCEAERKEREAFAMRHWQGTGLVPQVVDDVDECMLVMSYLPGAHLLLSRRIDGEEAFFAACHETGKATAALTCVPLADAQRVAFESRFYQDLQTLEAYLSRIVTLGRSITQRDPDFCGSFWCRSLDFTVSQLPCIYAERRVLYHQDIGNLHVQQGRFVGFYDLEMCRVGTASVQLGAALAYIADEPAVWPPFREGWEGATGEPLTPGQLRAAAAVHHLLCWRVICRYLSYDGTSGSGFPWADPADPAHYRRSIDAVHRTIGIEPL